MQWIGRRIFYVSKADKKCLPFSQYFKIKSLLAESISCVKSQNGLLETQQQCLGAPWVLFSNDQCFVFFST